MAAPEADAAPRIGAARALTVAAMIAFAANSLLSRAALGERAIDPVAFTMLRLGSGAIALAAIAALRRRAAPDQPRPARAWISAAALLLYALPFSLAYVRVPAGAGALALFGAVQVTMIGWGVASGERPRASTWIGLAGAVTGLAYLLWPGECALDPIGMVAMLVAGAGWGVYSLLGRAPGDPVTRSASAFRAASILGLPLLLFGWSALRISPRGALLAVLSGAVASGLGYVAWYAALRGLSPSRAALVQLSVPVIAAAGGVVVLGEPASTRLVVAGALVLGSVAIGVRAVGAPTRP